MTSKVGKINLLKRPLGIELEFSSPKGMVSYEPSGHKWEHDGSLTRGGLELVFPPAGGDAFIKLISNCIDAIMLHTPGIDKSCGFHVHVQARDFDWFSLRRILALWCKLENDIFAYLVSPERSENRYCQKITIPSDANRREVWQFTPTDIAHLMRRRLNTEGLIRRWMIKKLYSIDLPAENTQLTDEKNLSKFKELNRRFEDIKSHKRTDTNGCRYAAFNLHSYFHRGTVEFRLKEMTLNHDELIFWPIFCGWLVESVFKITDPEIASINSLQDWLNTTKSFIPENVAQWVCSKITMVRR